MTQPQAYNRETDFTERDGDDTNHAGINTELDAAALSINQLRDNLALIQADDGGLKAGIVTAESLDDSAFDAILVDVNLAVSDAQTAAESANIAALSANSARDQAVTAKENAETANNAAALNAATAALKAAETASAVAQAVDGEKDLFTAGVDYTKGTTTQLTLAYAPAKSGTVKVFFDGVFQHLTEWSLAGNVITFTAAIPADKVEVHYVIPSQFVGLSNADLEVLGDAQVVAQAGATSATTQAGIAATQAGIAINAKTAAELARDAALIQAGVYATEAAGRAAVADGVAFKVQGSGDVAAYEYRRTNSTTSVLIATYPSISGVTANMQQLGYTRNIIPELTFTTGMINTDGSIYTPAGGTYSSLFKVVPGATVIKIDCSNAYSFEWDNVVAYNAAGAWMRGLVKGVQRFFIDKGLACYVVVPSDVYFLRFSALTFNSIKVMSLADYAYEITQRDLLKESDNFFLSLYPQFKADTSVAYLVGRGTGYVPIQVGDKIKMFTAAAAPFAALGLFNANKGYIRTIYPTNSVAAYYEYTIDAVADAGGAYVVASSYDDRPQYFFTVERLKGPLLRVKEQALAKNFIQQTSALTFTAYNANSEVAVAGGVTSFYFKSSPSYIRANPGGISYGKYTVPLYAIKLKLISLPVGVTEVTVSDAISGGISSARFTALNQELIIFGQYNSGNYNITSSVNDPALRFDVTGQFGCLMDSDVFAQLKWSGIKVMLESYGLFSDGYHWNSHAEVAGIAGRLNSSLTGGRIVCFGDSLMTVGDPSVPLRVANYYGMTLTNLALSGSYVYDNIAVANLANIPTDTAVVLLGMGAGDPYVDGGSISATNPTTSQGIFNTAIDWIRTNRPKARIVLFSTPNDSVEAWAIMLRQLADYQSLPLADLYYRADVRRTPSITMYDGLHPNAIGTKRIASVFINTLRDVVAYWG